jgi:antirestriction protein
VQNPPSIKGREITDFIPSGVHPRDLNLSFLSNVNFKSASGSLDLIQRNAALESENRKQKKELMDQKLLMLEYKSSTEAKLEEAGTREENLIKSNEDFKTEMKQQQEEMKKQQEQTKMMLQQSMEMFNKQAKQ